MEERLGYYKSEPVRLLPAGESGHEAVMEHLLTGHLEVLKSRKHGRVQLAYQHARSMAHLQNARLVAEGSSGEAASGSPAPARAPPTMTRPAPAPPTSVVVTPAPVPTSGAHHRAPSGSARRRPSLVKLTSWQKARIKIKLTLAARDAKLSSSAPDAHHAANADTWEARHRTHSARLEEAYLHAPSVGATIERFEASLWDVRRNKYIAPEVKKAEASSGGSGRRKRAVVKAPFDVYKSIWAPRCQWTDSKDLFDTEAVWRDRFEGEWSQIVSLGIARTILRADDDGAEDEDADGIPDEVEEVGNVLWQHSRFLRHVFLHYATMNNSIDDISLNEWTAFTVDAKIVNKASKACRTRDLDSIFAEVNGMSKRAAKEAKGKGDGGLAKAAQSSHELNGCEFMVALVKVSINMFIVPGELQDVSESLDRLVRVVLQSSLGGSIVLEPDIFRRGYAYREATCDVLKAHEKELHRCFDFIAPASGDSNTITRSEWLSALRSLDIIGIDISERDALRCFCWSITAVIKPTSMRGAVRASTLPFEGFMEAVCHLSRLKALPHGHELLEGGFADAGSYMANLRDEDEPAYQVMLGERQIEWAEEAQPEYFAERVAGMVSIFVRAVDEARLGVL